MILIISHEKDEHCTKVQQILERKGHRYDLLDLSTFPANAKLSIKYETDHYAEAEIEQQDKKMKVSEYGSVWWRRPQPYTLHAQLTGNIERNFAYNECLCAMNGMLMLANVSWINHPLNDEVAARKAYQLKVAAQIGLTIPKTCITNNPSEAMKFIHQLGMGNVICKSFSATEQAWRETRLVKEDEMQKIEDVKYAPVIFQEYVRADLDLRITVIGEKIFPAAIFSQDTAYKFDYRMNYNEAKIEYYPLPEKLNQQLLQFMKQMGLIYGAIDLRKNKQGEYTFLEVNPAGQWLFMEQPTEMPISEALAEKLIEFDNK